MPPIQRRDCLKQFGGIGTIGLAMLLERDKALGGGVQHPARAKRVVQFYMSGAASQCDTFDYKPRLVEQHGKDWDPGEKVELFQSTPGKTLKSPWPWRQY
nr:DUF1501 domain-containing protein [Pirellula sp.]